MAYLIIERNSEDQVWRAIVVANESDGFPFIEAIAEDEDLHIAASYVIRQSSAPVTEIKLPDGTMDDGGALTLIEVAEAVYL
jgi:hypothetical protein